MKIVMLGSGNVATHLGKALVDAGHNVLQVWSRRLVHATQLAEALNATAIDQLDQVNSSADLYLISVVDDAIVSVLEKLTAIKGPLVHTSGSTSIQVFEPYAEAYGVFYPLQTFSKEVPIKLNNTPILIEASDNGVRTVLHELASSISTNVQYCTSEQRITLHVAGVFACNFTNHLYAIAQQLLEDKGLDFDLIRPLILETAQKVQVNLPSDVQTGPAVREDQLTLESHFEQLVNQRDFLRIYMLLSKNIIKRKD